MGQYYKAINLDKKEWLCPFEYKNGLKLMEHSWIGNSFMEAVEGLLVEGGNWYKTRIVWAGDYADNEESKEINLYQIYRNKKKVKIKPQKLSKTYRYIVNYSKKEYVDKDKVLNKDGWRIHPLSLLTCEGNGRGGGDYLNEESSLIGKWARDVLSIEENIPESFNELNFDLIE